MKEERSTQLIQASGQELHHAEMFKTMLDTYYNIQKGMYKDKTPAYMTECYEKVVSKYASKRAYVLELHAVFSK